MPSAPTPLSSFASWNRSGSCADSFLCCRNWCLQLTNQPHSIGRHHRNPLLPMYGFRELRNPSRDRKRAVGSSAIVAKNSFTTADTEDTEKANQIFFVFSVFSVVSF